MQKMNSNIIMIILLVAIGVIFALAKILNIPLSETALMVGAILLFLGIVFIHGWKTLGFRDILVFFLIAYCIPLLYEYTDGLGCGALVGFTVQYYNVLGPKFLGKVPYVIPLTWSILLYCAFTMTNIIFDRIRITQKFEERVSVAWFFKIVGIGIVAGLIMASLDLIIDPVMVALGAWSWPSGGSYYGIPLWNYEGWIEIPAVTVIIYSIYLSLMKRNQVYIEGEKRSRFTLFVVVLYLLLLLLFTMYAIDEQVISVIPWAAISMGFFAALTVLRFSQSKSSKEHTIS